MAKEKNHNLDPKDAPHEGHAAADALSDPKARANAESAKAGESIAAEAASTAQKADELRALDDQSLVALAEEATRADHWLNVARRAQAELENTIKRLRRDQEEAVRYAGTYLARDLLPVLDNLSRALQAAEAGKDFNALFKGIELTKKLLDDAMARNAIKPIEAAGKPFDPAHHEAVMMAADAKLDDNTVVQEFERGWIMHDRVLRAAKVSVNKKP
ncbi:MAG: nucleotide exchange factor GrpE [Planctomycetes bacterium]|nr:nucleotide exchange factor GrpE [Planctomycetota bacterium]